MQPPLTPEEFDAIEALFAALLAAAQDAREEAAILRLYARVERLYQAHYAQRLLRDRLQAVQAQPKLTHPRRSQRARRSL